MTLVSLLSIAKTALQTHQRAIDVTGHNIANVMTPGYTRQRLNLTAETPLRSEKGLIGRGVTDTGISAERNLFLDAAYRREAGNFAHADTLRTLMGRVEGVFNEPSDQSLGAALDGLFTAFNDLANDPGGGASRAAVRQAANELVQRFHAISARLDEVSSATDQHFRDAVGTVNGLTSQIADLNRRIVARGGPQQNAADLVDERARLLDQLATLTGVRVLGRSDGSVGVLIGDSLVVDGAFAQRLEARPQGGGGLALGVVGTTRGMTGLSGTLAALTELGTQGVPGVRAELDRLAAELVTQVNTIHRTGTTPGGATNTDFFDPTGLQAGTIALAAPIVASPNAIAAGTSGLPGDGSVALQLVGLRQTTLAALNGSTVGEFYIGLLANVASIVRDATTEAVTAETLRSGTQAQRAAETGVSTDEELVHLIAQQQAFSAAARLVGVADEMMQDLLRMV